MREIRTGKLIQSTREAQRLTSAELVNGICSRRTLTRLETGQTDCDMLLFAVLLQRLGKSPDKLEYIFSWEEYRKECIRDWFVECVFKKRKKWAEQAIRMYWEKTEGIGTVHRMYLCRGRAMVAYWIDGDAGAAERWLEKALDATFPHWRCSVLEECRVSAMELENMLALVRMRRELREDVQELLQSCGHYISRFVTDGEEHAKIFCKYAWLEAQQELEQECPGDALQLCLSAIEELRQYGIEYFMRPLLDMTLRCYEQLEKEIGEEGESSCFPENGCECGEWEEECRRFAKDCGREAQGGCGREIPVISRERCRIYLKILRTLHCRFGESWYPSNSILYNCCQKSYHLDYEILRTERGPRGQRQPGKTEPKAVVNRRSASGGRRFARAMGRIGLTRERKSSFVITDSFETLELRREIQKYVGRKQYDRVKEALSRLEQRLDMGIFENRRTIQLLRNMVDIDGETRSFEEMLAEDLELLKKTYRFVPASCQNTETALQSGEEKTEKYKAEETGSISRAPLQNETDVVNQIAVLLDRLGRGEESLQLYEWALQTVRKSRVQKKHRFLSYGLLLGNAAAEKCSATESGRALRYGLRCGKLSFLGKDYLTLACALEDEQINHELCCRMTREAYYLFELSYSSRKQDITRQYYVKNYGGNVEDII